MSGNRLIVTAVMIFLSVYLAESDITTDELLSLIDIEELDIDGMVDEEVMLLNDDELDYIMDEYAEFELENDI